MKKLLLILLVGMMMILSSCGPLAFLNPFGGKKNNVSTTSQTKNLSRAEAFWDQQKIFVDNSTNYLLKAAVIPGTEGKKILEIYDESISENPRVEIEIPSVFTDFNIDYILRISAGNYYLIGNFSISIGKSSGKIWKIVLLKNANTNPILRIPDAEAENINLKINVLTSRNEKFPGSWQPIQMDNTGWLYFINTANAGLYAFDYETGDYYRLVDKENKTLDKFSANDYYQIINNFIVYSSGNKIYVGKLGVTATLEEGQKIKTVTGVKELYDLSNKVSYPIAMSNSGYIVYLDNTENISKLKYLNLNASSSKPTELKLFTDIEQNSDVKLGGSVKLTNKDVAIKINNIESAIYSDGKTYILFSDLTIKYKVQIILDYKVQIPLDDQNEASYYAVLVVPHNRDNYPLFTKKVIYLFEKPQNENNGVKKILNKHFFAIVPADPHKTLEDGSYIKRFDLTSSTEYKIEFKKVQEEQVKDAADINLIIKGNKMQVRLMTPVNLDFEKLKNLAVRNNIPYKFKTINSKFADDFGIYMYFEGTDLENKPIYGILDLTKINNEKMEVIRVLNNVDVESLKREAVKNMITK
ncbi:hypothetical protein XO10_07005 [Marinitoga sp. 1135]|uniref:Uncharacterized protein n=1 Tax=Marinitoga piezophila (strain DSM 14283 / JCM 11233 / KA3) TaxID=443254 RepID=H2J3S6_MARPK|nr:MULTISPECIES: hypothetical protein [Marinitoga]AEX85818.1 hypothetical protein Marpi_1423 [Marinitoga piezophila KA3]APT76257.1 hypothetical protein LN42_07600 [Marinitoga sp. 1137]NUU96022.1 hypothetical protein [Marinitoga sp. 1135]NUU97934.1 hypothetical protein [Marinitoga sp. 1138]